MTPPSAPPATASDGPAAHAGAPRPVQPLLLDIDGLKCAGCVRAAERTLLQQPGVREASVNLLTRTAWVGLEPAADGQDPAPPPSDHVQGLLDALAGLGFRASARSEADGQAPAHASASPPGWWSSWRQLVVALVLLLLSGAGHLSPAGPLGSLSFHALLATVALAGPGRPILVRGVRAALAGMPSMDTLVGLGVGSAYLASVVAWIWPAVGWQCFFNEPVMLLGFVLLGRFLEDRARRRTGSALEQLARLQPDTARLLMADGSVRSVRPGGLRPGDRIQLLAGDRIPVDGVVLEGTSSIDMSSLTGEPMPVEVAVAAPLSAGCLNLSGTLVLAVERTGSATAMARIIRMVEEAQARKAPIQGLADRVSGRFCVVVLALALATFLFWWQLGSRWWPQVLQMAPSAHAHGGHVPLGAAADTPIALALQLAIAVLVVACPCALGLATPTVITVASGLAARRGWLFRGGDVIEATATVDRVLFDKTGTLTRGRPLVSALATAGSLVPGSDAATIAREERHLLGLAASLEQQSRHPLAHALIQEARSRDLSLEAPSEVQTIAGCGVIGRLPSQPSLPIRVGRLDWLQEQGVPVDPAWRASLDLWDQRGVSTLAVSAGPSLIGLIAVEDTLRPDAPETVASLRRMGLASGVLSGDRQASVERLGAAIGLDPDQLAWELRPEDKLTAIERFQQRQTVAMVGDGINDAPALARAQVGIAVGTGTQIAQDSSDVVVLGDRLADLPELIGLARRAMGRIRQNLWWAFGYNLIAIPLAAGVLLPGAGVLLSPPLAALLMAFSSITVVLNALSLAAPPQRRAV
ncbi:cation-translocating P-type ATPase [Synechococcus sp. RSCCF101]|uniref:heavy metal translocating P-type ATPase n=1 Tax=Synechococcus sp. RSCCF101 TaxID=2511069 RepID=UPI001245F24A|nr:cation-translocating P-type ATPase [Synechococcus sp. RSCCF101]QEY32893.1 cation-translocating P-type ATPase [Synechococcus sp. RSCCF101]